MKPGPAKQFDPETALDAAVQVFWAKGYEAASLSELMKAMGISKKSLYDTFGNKRSLFLKVIERYSNQSILDLRKALLKEGSPLANVRGQLSNWKDGYCAERSRGCLYGNNIADFDTSDAEVAQILRLNLARIEDAFAEALERAQFVKELPSHIDPRALAQMLVVFSQGAALISRVLDSKEPLDGAFEALETFLK